MEKQLPIATILAGGLGTRLRSAVYDKPKAMADICGRPFLSYLLDQLLRHGFNECILCTGYESHQIEDYFGDSYNGLSLIYSVEPEPLGTAGALRNALPVLGDKTLIMNGDSYCDANLEEFSRDRDAMVITRAEGNRYGGVGINWHGEVVSFEEKQPGQFINAGIYVLSHDFIERIQLGETSLEYDVFPNCKLSGYITEAELIDIGTPESYEYAQEHFCSSGQGRDDQS